MVLIIDFYFLVFVTGSLGTRSNVVWKLLHGNFSDKLMNFNFQGEIYSQKLIFGKYAKASFRKFLFFFLSAQINPIEAFAENVTVKWCQFENRLLLLLSIGLK